VQFEELEQRIMLSTNNPIPPPPLPGQLTPLQGVVGTPNSLDPYLVNTAYLFNGLSYDISGNITKANGAGETIAIVDAYGSPTIVNDVKTFDAETYLTPGESIANSTGGISDYDAEGNFFLTVQKLAPTANTIVGSVADQQGWARETSLDVEWAHAVAPGAHILLVEAPSESALDLLDADVYAAQQKGVVAISDSWGELPANEPDDAATLDGYLVTPTGHTDNNGMTGGVVFLAASGDTDTNSFPAASRNVLSVGGETDTIDLNALIENIGPWEPAAGVGSGGGPSTTAPTYNNPIVALDANPETGVWIYDSTPDPSEGATIQGGWTVIGGTSFSCPAWAGLISIIDQGLNLRGFGSMNTEQCLGEEPYDDRGTTALGDTGPTIATDASTTPATVTVLGDPASGYGILGLAENDLATNADFDQLPGGNDGSDKDSNFPLWTHMTNSVTVGTTTTTTTTSTDTNGTPDITITPAVDNTGWGLPDNDSGNIDADTTDPTESARGGFIQDMVGGAVGISFFSDTLDSIYFTEQPVSTQVGSSINSTSAGIQVAVFSPTTNGVDTSFNGAITINILEGGTLLGVTTVNAVNGVASFTGLSIDQQGTYEFVASTANINPGNSNAFNVTVAPAAQLGVVAQPISLLESTSMATPIQIALEDSLGNTVYYDTGTVIGLTIASGPAGAVLTGQTTASTVNGVATFNGVSANVLGSYTLEASVISPPGSIAPVTTAAFSVEEPKLVFIQGPQSFLDDTYMVTPLTVAVEDAAGNTSTVFPATTVTLSIASGPAGAVLSGQTSAVTVNGIATFDKVSANLPGSYTITATAGPSFTPVSGSFTVDTGHLVFIEQPTSLYEYAGMNEPVKVAVEDQNDNISTILAGTPIILSIASGPPGSVLTSITGVITGITVNGVATFFGLTANIPGTDTLKATSATLATGYSSPFSVVQVPVTQHYLLNGVRLSPETLLLQQIRNAQTFVGAPTAAQVQLSDSENEQPAAVVAAAVPVTSSAFSAVDTDSPFAAGDAPSAVESQLLDSTISTDNKILN